METIFPGLGALKLVFWGENYAPMLIARFLLTPGSPPPLYPPLGGPEALAYLSVVRVLNYKSSGGEEKNRRTISSPIQISMETGAMLSNIFRPYPGANTVVVEESRRSCASLHLLGEEQHHINREELPAPNYWLPRSTQYLHLIRRVLYTWYGYTAKYNSPKFPPLEVGGKRTKNLPPKTKKEERNTRTPTS